MTYVPECVLDDFWGFCRRLTGRNPDYPLSSVEEYIDEWLTSPYDELAARNIGVRDFGVFMVIVAYIFAVWHDEREACKDEAHWRLPIPWNVTHVLKNDPHHVGEWGRRIGTDIFNPLYFRYHIDYHAD